MPPATLDRIDRMLSDVAALLRGIQTYVAEERGGAESPPGAWLPIGTAAQRFAMREDTMRLWCRRQPGLGRKRGERWEVNVSQLRVKLGLKSNSPA